MAEIEVEDMRVGEGETVDEQDEGQLLRINLFQGDLLELPRPEEGSGDFIPDWFTGNLPALVFPPLAERGIESGGKVDLQITPYHLYYGALRELAETADEDRSEALKRLALHWNENAILEVCELARFHVESDLESALLHYELALELDENYWEALQNAGMCEYAMAQAMPDERDDRLDSAADYLKRAVYAQPNEGFSWWSWARALHDQGQDEDARNILWQFATEYPEGKDREMIEAALAVGFESNDDAEDSDRPDPQVQQTFMEAQQAAFGENPAAAVDLLTPLVEAYPEAGEIWFVLGVANRRSGDPEESERCLRRAARLASTEPFIWWELARAYMDMEQWRPAESAIDKALELDPENAQYLADRGRILLSLGDRAGAEESIRRAEELVPDDPEVQEAVALLGSPE